MANHTAGGKENRSKMIPIINPSTEEQIAEITDGGQKAVDEAVARARETFESGVWIDKPASERGKILWRLADIIERDVSKLAAVESSNTGMSEMQLSILISTGAELVRYFAGWCTKIYGISNDIRMMGLLTGAMAQYHAYTIKEPYGVAGLIVSWNGPLYVALSKVAPALAAGCSCVLKPSSLTPLSAMKLMDLLSEAGVPDGVVNLVNGSGSTTGAALASHPGVDKLSFTGSVEVGKELVLASAGNLKRLTLELGGKSPVLIFDDADITKTVLGAGVGIFAGAGQGCVCGSRIYAQRGVYEQVVDGLANLTKTLQLGGPEDEGAMIGPIISESQLKRILGFIEESREQGVEVVAGGERLDRRGYFMKPTVLTNVRQDMRLMREEIFGPVVAIVPFDEEEEAVAMANDSSYGLAGAVWTQDGARAHRLAKSVQSGMIWLNCQLVADPSMPFGGYKQSGWGLEYGWAGIDAYLKTKTVYTCIAD